MHTFQQHTEDRLLSFGRAFHHNLEKWDAICEFIRLLAEDEMKASKSIKLLDLVAHTTYQQH